MNRKVIAETIDPIHVFRTAFNENDQIYVDGKIHIVSKRMEYASYLYGLRIIIRSCFGGIVTGVMLKYGYHVLIAGITAGFCSILVSAIVEQRAINIFIDELKE